MKGLLIRILKALTNEECQKELSCINCEMCKGYAGERKIKTDKTVVWEGRGHICTAGNFVLKDLLACEAHLLSDTKVTMESGNMPKDLPMQGE